MTFRKKANRCHALIPANREDFDNGATLWKNDWAKYRAAHPQDQDCAISESDNRNYAQQLFL